MVLESIINGARNVLLAEVPGTAINVAEIAGAGLVIGLLIFGARKLFQGTLGSR